MVDKVKYSCDYLTKRTYSTTKLRDSTTVSNVKSLIKKARRERAENRIEGKADKNDQNKKGKNDKQESRLNDEKEDELILSKVLRNDNQYKCNCDNKSLREEDKIDYGWEG